MMKRSLVIGMLAVYFISASIFPIFAEDRAKKPWPIHIQEVKPADTKPASLDGLSNPLEQVTIKGGNFVRDGKPVFLISEGNFAFPDVCKILGVDIVELYCNPYSVSPKAMNINTKNSKIDITFRPPTGTETAVRELLTYGIYPYLEFLDNRGAYDMKIVEEHYTDMFMPKKMTSYLGYNETNPLGYKLRRSMWQNYYNLTAPYPVFVYEMFNEVPYANGGKYEQELFRKCLKTKFKTLARMNRILNTKYNSFSEINIPNLTNWRFGWQRAFPGISENLFTEWCVFQSKRSGEMAKIWYDTTKSMSKHYPSHVTLQSPWLGGPLGFDPREKVKGEDVFGAETYSAAFDGNLSPQLVGMELMKGPQLLDVVRAASPDKPIFDCEGRVGKSNAMGTFASLTSSKIVDLAGTWKFKDGTNTDGKKAGWYRTDFSDANWGEIKVPGMWGTTKAYKNVQVGWYRRTFDVPKTAFKKYPRLYLSGKKLTDKADVYLNGKYLYTTKKWNELMQIDVTNILKPGKNEIAIRIENRFFRDGMYFGGIRKFIIITDNAKDTSFAYTSPEQLKRFLWNEVVHGFSGKSLWHSGVPCRGIPDHGTMYQDALRSLPYFKSELANVADIVMPRPRIKGRQAIYWPYETLLALKTSATSYKGGSSILGAMDKYYGSMLFSGIPLDFVDSQSIQSSGLKQYRMLCFVNSERLKPAVLPIIERYVRKGGIVVVNGG
ncbi:MAG: hypothetical protein RAP03_16460, partial [Candidatus Electryonea clarkiae]|nr:hypothetical protein [Candidatus Electryonea clarkiae]